MCEELTELRRATVSYCSRFDPEAITPGEAAKVVDEARLIVSAASALLAHGAARAAQGDSWKKDGHRSAAEELASKTGSSVASARELLDIGRRLKAQPEIDAAARLGKLSSFELGMITDATEADPSAERKLLEQAAHGSVAVLKDACALTKANADPDPEARRAKIHEKRSVRAWTDIEGVWRLGASGNPELGAQVMAALRQRAEALFHEARKQGRREHPDAYAFDALVELARESLSSGSCGTERSASIKAPKRKGPPVKLLVRVDLDVLLRGARKGSETCELVGYGPIAVSAIEDLCSMGSPFVAAILTKAEQIAGVAHLGRRPTAHQQSALEFLYPSCAAARCPSQARLERDHRIDWSKSHFTAFDLLDLLCSHHHDLKTREDWALVDGSGKRPFVSPDDPRHPRHNPRHSDPRHSRHTRHKQKAS
jgi:Domain of unknown function (DUF222)